MRKLAGFAVPFGAAVFGAVYLAPAVSLPYLAALSALLALPGLRLRERARLRVVLAALGLAAGFLWTWGHHTIFLAPAQQLDGAEREVLAAVIDWPRETPYGSALTVRLRGEGLSGVKALLYTEGEYAALKPGDELRGTVKLRRADLRGGMESEYYYARGIYLLAYARGELSAEASPVIPPRCWPQWAAKTVKDSVGRVFPPDTAGFVTALLTGDAAGMDGGLYSAFRRTGLAHVVAVSGLHVAFLAGLLAVLLGKGPLSAGAVIAALLLFSAAAGNSPSVLRAVYLQSALLIAPLLGRENDQVTSLSAALMLLLLWNPRAAASVGLQLSFAAVAGIYLAAGPLYARWTRGLGRKLFHRLWSAAVGSLAASLGALVFTVPLMALHFGSISLIAPLANLLTLWAVSWAFLGGIIAAAAGLLLPGAGSVIAWLTAWLVRYIQWMALALGRLPFSSVGAAGYLGAWLGFAYVLLLLWILWKGEGKRPVIPAAACAVTLCAALAFNTLSLKRGALRLSVLDVGQGASALLRSGGYTALVDCGGSSPDGSGDAAADAVQALGANRLNYLILTHFHDDHANGVERLFARLEVDTLIVPDAQEEDPLRAEILSLAAAEGAEVRFITDNARVLLGEAVLTLYAPLGDGGANEEGLSVLATSGSFDVLITGDMNAAVEKRLLKYNHLPDIEVLVAGHHGSAHSSSEELLLATRPEYAVISVGYNSYGHPAPEALERLAAAGCAIYRTDLMGSVSVTAD